MSRKSLLIAAVLLSWASAAFAQGQPQPIGPITGNGSGGGGGTGTVTSVSVVTANGISGTVANPTTVPAITLTLGAITPTSVTVPLGSLSAPSINFSGDTTTGIYDAGSGIVAISSAGTQGGYFSAGLHLDGVSNAGLYFANTGQITFAGAPVIYFSQYDTTANNTILIGQNALAGIAISATSAAYASVVVGSSSGPASGIVSIARLDLFGDNVAPTCTTCTNSSIGGTQAALHATTVQNSVVWGDTAAANAASIVNSVAIGDEAGNTTSALSSTVVIGELARLGGGTISNVAAVGYQVLRYNAGNDNAALGANAGLGSGSGTLAQSVLVGSSAGSNSTGGVNQILIGYNIQASSPTVSNYLNIGGAITANLSTLVVTLPGGIVTGGTTLNSAGAQTWDVASTIASGATATLDDLYIESATTTVTGTTNITTAKGFNKVSFYQPTFTDASAATVSIADTVYIDNAPACSGSLSCTQAFALRTGAGNNFFAGANETTVFPDGQAINRDATIGIQRIITSLGNGAQGLMIDLQNQNTTASQTNVALIASASVPTSNSTAQGALEGLQANGIYAGTSTDSAVFGGAYSASNLNTGTATSLTGIFISTANSGGGTNGTTTGSVIGQPTGANTGKTSTWTNISGIEIRNQNPTGVGTNTLTNPPVALLIDSQTASGAYAINQVGSGIVQFASAVIELPNVTSDATLADSTLCRNATAGQVYYGSGTLGICLGTSSARYKNTFDKEQYGMEQIAALDPMTFHYNSGHGFDPTHKYHGFTAEELFKVMPECVGLDADGRPNSVDEFCMFPAMVNAIKQQQTEITNLQKRIR